MFTRVIKTDWAILKKWCENWWSIFTLSGHLASLISMVFVKKKKGLWLAISSLAGDVFSSANCFWESLNVGFLENDFICYTKVILKCQTSFGSCSCFVF